MIEALLFDFNGVIADDEEQHRAALGVVLAGEGLSLTPEQYYSDFLGFDDRRCLVGAFRRAGKALPAMPLEQLLAEKSRVYQELIDRSLALVPGAVDFVPRAAERFRLGLVSGALRQEVQLVLGRAGLQRDFDVLVAAEDVERCKPDPAGDLAPRGALDRRRSPASFRVPCRRRGSPPCVPARSSRGPRQPSSRSRGPAPSRPRRGCSPTTSRSRETERSSTAPCSRPRA